MFDIIIENGTIVDGSGLPAYRGDVGIRDGRLVAVGRRLNDVPATQRIDATGQVVSPGFIDPHTHYDAQLCFDPFVYPAIEHGVTTIVTGNCSLSLAPVRPDQRESFGAMFRLIEEMPKPAFDEGVDWRWGEGFGAMLDVIAANTALNVAPLVGHSVLRMYVLGNDARRAATDDEIHEMAELLRECLAAGAVGMSTSYIDIDDDFRPVPSRFAHHDELRALCAVLGEYGRMLQIVHEFFDPGLTVSRVEMLGDLSREFGIPTTLSPLFQIDAAPQAVDLVLAAVAKEWASGGRVWPQVQTRPIDISWTLDQRSIMFLGIPGWWPVVSLPTRAERLAALTDPATRASLIASLDKVSASPHSSVNAAAFVIREVTLDSNRSLVGRTLGEIAAERGTTPAELFIDLSVEEDLGIWFIRANAGHHNAAVVGAMLADPRVHIGASDGGAHVGSFATYGDTGLLLSKYVRETGALSLEGAVKKITYDTAIIWGLADRGLLREGYAADVCVFDPERVDRGPEIASDDFPGGGTRWIRNQVGVHAVLVNGVVTWTAADGYASGARAGVIATR